jgi:hypothetical protein
MGWSSSASSASSATSGGYRPREDGSRGSLTGGIVMSTVLVTAGLAAGLDPSDLAGAALVGAILLGSVHAWTEIRGLQKGLETARTGPLPLLEDPREGPVRAKDWSLSNVGWTLLAVLLVAGFVAYVVFSFDEAVSILLGGTAAIVAGEAAVLVWLRRRRRQDGMQVYVRTVEGDDETADPPKYHLVPRGS